MSSRNLAIGIVLLVLLGTVAFFAFQDPDNPIIEPEAGPEIEQPEVGELQVENADLGKPEARTVMDAGMNATDEGMDDPFFRKSMAGFKGRVVNQEQLPVAKAVVKLARVDPQVLDNPGLFALESAFSMPKLNFYETKTDAEGCFLLEGVWPRSMYFLLADADGDSPTSKFLNNTAGPGQVVDLGDIQLKEYGIIVGQVVDPEREPVEGALVRAVDLPAAALDAAPIHRFDPKGALIVTEGPSTLVFEVPPYAERYFEMAHAYAHVPLTRTDADGNFKLRGVMPGNNIVVINKKGLLALVKPGVRVKPGKEKDVKRLRMKEGEIVQGSVVDQEGKAIQGARVIVAHKHPLMPVQLGTYMKPTDKNGQFTSAGFPKGEVIAAARRDANEPWVMTEPTSVADDLVIKLPSKFGVTVTLKSKINRPIENPVFKLAPQVSQYVNPFDFASMGVQSWVDVKSRVEKLENGSYHIKDLSAGMYSLAVMSDGHGAGRTSFELKSGEKVTVELPAKTSVQVLVTDIHRKPIKNAKVYYENRGNDRGQRMHEMPLVAGITDKEGRVAIEHAQPGRLRLSASHPAYGFAHAEAQVPAQAEITIAMEPPGALAGLLTENGEVPEPGKWMLILERQWNSGPRGAMPDMPSFKAADLKGNFEFQGIRPGKYRLQVVKSSDVVGSPGGVYGFVMDQMTMGNQGQRIEVEVIADQVTRVQIDAVKPPEILTGPTARITGRVVLNGRVVKGLLVTGWGGRRLGTRTDETGNFDLGQVKIDEKSKKQWVSIQISEPMKGDIFTSGGRSRLYETNQEVTDGQNLHLQINIETSMAEGIVFGPGGQPLADVMVRANGLRQEKNADGKSSRWVNFNRSIKTDKNGRFRMANLPVGNYEFTAKGVGGVGRLKKITLQAGVPATGLSINLKKVYRVKGKVDLSLFAGKEIKWMSINVTSKSVKGFQEWEGIQITGPRKGTFELKSLEPGSYDLRIYSNIHGWGRQDVRIVSTQPIVVTDSDLKDVLIRLQEVQPPKPKPKPKKSGGGVKKAG